MEQVMNKNNITGFFLDLFQFHRSSFCFLRLFLHWSRFWGRFIENHIKFLPSFLYNTKEVRVCKNSRIHNSVYFIRLRHKTLDVIDPQDYCYTSS